MKLSSNDFKHNGFLDSKFGYKTKNISPHLKWEKFPPKTMCFALSCNDPDAPSGNWVHWIVINIPAKINEIPQGGPVPGIELVNDFGKKGYGGPAPPSGTHRYNFKVYALDLTKIEGVNKKNFEELIEDHALDSAEITGLFKK
ncbi:MAG: YbhB/YbcL family Raf kinase inhibitor-like protein [Candidatus Lokiarchaeota archaeon]|nr:YbhB/YbcL family Raf kinase inhibitor-like protein [Candidatus Lokiarchaeota archaeon]